MNERYSQELLTILEAAQKKAMTAYHQELTCMHLLDALAESDGFFPFLLSQVGASVKQFKADTENSLKKLPSVKGQDRGLMMSVGLGRSTALAEQDAKGQIDIVHIIGRMVTDGDSDAQNLLKKYAITKAKVDAAFQSYQTEAQDDEAKKVSSFSFYCAIGISILYSIIEIINRTIKK